MMSAGEITSLSVWIDGSVVDGSAGVGYQIRAQGDKVSWGYDSIPECSSSTGAEAHALVRALEEVSRFPNVTAVYVYTDSESVAHMVDPDERAEPRNEDLGNVINRAREMFQSFEFWNIKHKPRKYNEDKAHDLANRGHRLGGSEGPKLHRNVRLSD